MIFSPFFLNQIATSKFLKNLEQGRVIIDNSEYSTWSSCFVMGLYSGGLRRVGARSRTPLAFGGAVHVGLEAFFRGEKDWLAKALEDAAETQLDSMGDPKRNTQRLEELLTSYILHYENSRSDQFDILTIDGIPAVEQSFTVPLGTIDIPYNFTLQGIRVPEKISIIWAGKIDLLTRFEGALAPVDHKTTSVMGEKFVDDKVRSSQMLGYNFAAHYLSKSVFGGLPVFGARINALASRSSGFEFRLFDIPYPEWKISEWQAETLLNIRSLIMQLNHFFAHSEAVPTREHCVTKYGKCPYFDVCDSIPVMRDRMIFDDSYFFVSDWSPLAE